MSTINIEVKNNFATVFANLNTQEELSAVANAIREQLINAVNTRKNEITAGTKTVSVEVSVNTPAVEVAPEKTPSKKSVTAAAKEAAAKMKKEKGDKKSEKKEESKSSSKSVDTTISITDTKAIKELGLKFEKYSDKCWVLRGDTKPLRKTLKDEYKGVFNSRLSGGEGWVFRNERAQELAKALGMKVKIA